MATKTKTLKERFDAALEAGYSVGPSTLQRAAPELTDAAAEQLARELGAAMHVCGITNARRAALFIATVAHESGGFLYRREIWGPTDAQRGYEGRRDLGNTVKGDGKRYMGRGFIQITGRANYRAAGKALGIDLVSHPSRLERRDLAVLSAAWWWMNAGCNQLADTGGLILVTRRVNGGLNGYADRRRRYTATIGRRRYLTPKKRSQ